MENKIKKISKFSKKDDSSVVLREIKEYNINNDIIRNTEFDEDGNQSYEFIAKYDDTNKLIQEITTFVDEEDSETKDYSYENDLLSQIVINSGSGWQTILKYNYDDSKNKVTIDVLDEDGTKEETIIKIYNDKKQIIEESLFDEDDKLKSRTKYSFSDENKMILQEEYDNKDRIEKSTEFSYNEKGKIELSVAYNHKGKIIDWQKLFYDENDRFSRQEDMAGNVISFSYNNEGKETIEKHFSNNGAEILNRTTRYDDNNNIIEQISEGLHNQESLSYEYEYF